MKQKKKKKKDIPPRGAPLSENSPPRQLEYGNNEFVNRGILQRVGDLVGVEFWGVTVATG